ncbi:MAG: hypothetical protein QNJ44_01655 [Rhodobacter sp.]|nr:hypothetical protein [Rhodobacter sp.]
MTDDTGNLILDHMRRFDSRSAHMEDGMRDIKEGVTGVGEQLARVNRRLDRLDACVETIAKRLDLVEG